MLAARRQLLPCLSPVAGCKPKTRGSNAVQVGSVSKPEGRVRDDGVPSSKPPSASPRAAPSHPIPPVPCSRLTSPGRCGAARPALYTSWHAVASLSCEKKGAGRLRLALRPGSPGAGFIASAAGPPPAPPVPSRRSWPRPPRALVFSSGGSRGGNVCARGEAG